MLQQIDLRPYDVLASRRIPAARPAIWPSRRMARGAVADREVPLFAHLRATQGLPVDDRRWWPDRSGRRRAERTAAEVSAGADLFAPGRHVLVVGEAFPAARELSTPTVELLERTLAGLRAWDAGGSVSRP